jgi:sigma-B regulation protein RsbU (phosphoserine phosphatase)
VEAARLTALARYTLRAAAMAEASPAGILSTLSEAFVDQLDPRWFCTAVFASVRRSTAGATVVLCAGGHPLPLLLAVNGKVREIGMHGELLGVYREPKLVDSSVELAPGDALILYTDGLVDRRSEDGTRYGEERLIEVARGAQGLDAESIASWMDEDVRGYGSAPLRDDIAPLVIRLPVEDPLRRRESDSASSCHNPRARRPQLRPDPGGAWQTRMSDSTASRSASETSWPSTT